MSKSSRLKAPPLVNTKNSGKTGGSQSESRREPILAGDRHSKLAEAAYCRAEQRGFAPGHEMEHWLAAEAEIDQRIGSRND